MSKIKIDLFDDIIVYKRKSFSTNPGKSKFTVNFNKSIFKDKINFDQDCSVYIKKKLTIKGLHYQYGKYAQHKIVTVLQGNILDFFLDLRKSSKTFLKYGSISLSSKNLNSVFIPKGFAHGYIVKSDNTIINYKISGTYRPDKERIVNFLDPYLNIKFPKNIKISKKDLKGSGISNLKKFFK